MTITLKEVTRETLRTICKLDAGDGATQVAPNAVSIAEASFYNEAWFRAIYNDETPVGFVMLYDPTLAEKPEEPHFFLWRLMIDQTYQRKGLGRTAVKLLIDHVRARPGAEKLLVSHMSTVDELGRFYGSLGFVYTGAEDDGEKVMALELQPLARMQP
ncbi:MAG: GNAT family N-acetyltransferase [Burkholderiaceae bacterium]|nr:GNAT family N-acetyltransferase [Burkholderiaceae bacterium]